MGGVNGNEPPFKRLKSTSVDLDNLSNISSISSQICPLGGSMSRPRPSEGKEDFVGSRGVIKRVEFVRIIAEALYSLGYKKSGAELENESEIELHSPAVHVLRNHVLDGNWNEAVVTLHKVGLADDNILRSASFLILEQKFFELLDEDKLKDALKTLRNEITPLKTNQKRVHELCSCIVSPSRRASLGSINLGVKSNSRMKVLEELQKLFPPTVMIPERRLEHLVEQALSVQSQDCYFHNSLETSISLYTDHRCGMDQIPSRTIQELHAHDDEVWFLNFSNNGKYLASSSKDKSAIIWEVHDDGGLFLKHKLIGHEKSVLMVSWSPDDREVLTCGMEEVVRRWHVSSGICLHVYEKTGVGLISCGWFPDGKHFFAELTDMNICLWSLDGKELECWKGHRTMKNSDMAVTRDGKRIVSMSKANVIFLLDRESKFKKLIEEDAAVTSFSLSDDDKFLLVNLVNQEIHLWSIEGEPMLVTKYRGHKRDRYMIRSCFGGLNQAFIASGSEDSQVTGDVLDKVLSSGHGSFPYAVLFYASWCPFSRDIRPTFSALSSMFPQMSHLAVEESSAMPSVFSRYGVHSFPSILIMNQTTKVRYHGPKDLRSLVRFYKETAGVSPVAYLEDDRPRSSGNSRSLWPWDGSLKAVIANEPYLAFSLIFLCMKLIIKFFPKIISCLKSLWISYAWHVNLGIFDESRQLLERARHVIDLKKLWNKLRLGSKARNFQNGANNARVWARLP